MNEALLVQLVEETLEKPEEILASLRCLFYQG